MRKSIYIKKVFLLLLMVSLFSFRTAGRAAAYDIFDALADSLWEDTTVYFTNHTGNMVDVAICYESSTGDWICTGWLNVGPGRTDSFTFTTGNQYFYYYAESSEAYWSDSDGPLITVISNRFNYDIDNMECPAGPDRRDVRFTEVVAYEYYHTVNLRY